MAAHTAPVKVDEATHTLLAHGATALRMTQKDLLAEAVREYWRPPLTSSSTPGRRHSGEVEVMRDFSATGTGVRLPRVVGPERG